MFMLKELPNDDVLARMSQEYTNLKPETVKSVALSLRIASDLLSTLDSYFDEFGLSQGRFMTMLLLKRDGTPCLTPAELAAKAGVTRATMTGLIDGLERDSYVTRLTRTDDRRKVDVALTEKGLRLLDQILPHHYTRMSQLMHELTSHEQLLLTELLNKVAKGIPRLLAKPTIEPSLNLDNLNNEQPAIDKSETEDVTDTVII